MGQITPLHSHVTVNPTSLFLFVTTDVPTACHVLFLHWICCILCVCVFPCNVVINLSCFFLHLYLVPTSIGRRAKTGSKLTSVCRWSFFFFLHENTNFCSLACMHISHGNGRVFLRVSLKAALMIIQQSMFLYTSIRLFLYPFQIKLIAVSKQWPCCWVFLELCMTIQGWKFGFSAGFVMCFLGNSLECFPC